MIFLILAGLVLVTKPAYAYLDPGTGSYIFQIVVATLLASGYFFRDKFGKIIGFIRGLFTKKTSEKKTK